MFTQQLATLSKSLLLLVQHFKPQQQRLDSLRHLVCFSTAIQLIWLTENNSAEPLNCLKRASILVGYL